MLTPRQSALIATIVSQYTQTAKPVSSKEIEESGFFGLRSATIRGEMNDLEELGYLTQFHTSGGRIPTDIAYRYYVDNFVDPEKLEPSKIDKRKISAAISEAGNDPYSLNKNIAKVLSNICDNLVITKIDQGEDFFKFGLSGLFELPDFREFDKAFRLTSFFDQFESVFDEFEKHFFSEIGDRFENLNIFIGDENTVRNVKDETVMFTRYNLPKRFQGSLTLIGPTRMDYQKNIGLIKFATDELNKLAKQS
jgi:heat-inducible transcriptional repressor